MLTISIHLDPYDPQDIAQARGILGEFNSARATTATDLPVPQVPSPQPAGREAVEADAIADLWERTGLSLRKLVKASAEQDGEFSIGDLAAVLGVSPTSARSRFANLGRSVKAMREAVPGAPPLYVEVQP